MGNSWATAPERAAAIAASASCRGASSSSSITCRLDDRGVVIAGTVLPDLILAVAAGRSESEVVVQPKFVYARSAKPFYSVRVERRASRTHQAPS